MSDDALPQDLRDYLGRQLAGLHANVRLVFVFDPPGRLALAQPVMAGGRAWTVFRYPATTWPCGPRCRDWTTWPGQP